MKRTVVIGAGVGGLAVACRLAAKGDAVQVLESSDGPGGKLSQIQAGDFRFDAGPSLCTLPQWVDDVFRDAGKDPRQYWNYSRLNTTCHYFFEDGKQFFAPAEPEEFANHAATVFGAEPDDVRRYLDHSRKIFEGSGGLFLQRSLHRLSTWIRRETLSALVSTSPSYLLSNLHRHNETRIREPHLVQVFDRFATYNGSNPWQTPAMMSVIPHLEHHLGSWWPEGGMFSITKALYALALDLGVEFHFQTPAKAILHQGRRVTGVAAGDKTFVADRVVSNLDVTRTYRTLMPGIREPKRITEQERSSSGIVFYWGLSKEFPQLHLHNIFFSSDYENEFREIFREKRIPTDPTVYINITSKFNAGDSPQGQENWFVMINVPAGENKDWSHEVDTARERILAKLSRMLGEDIRSLIVAEQHLDPGLISARTGAWQGALYGSSSHSPFSAFLRHPNFHSRLQNLYFVGGTVHPGGGIPLCLSSAKIVSEMIA